MVRSYLIHIRVRPLTYISFAVHDRHADVEELAVVEHIGEVAVAASLAGEGEVELAAHHAVPAVRQTERDLGRVQGDGGAGQGHCGRLGVRLLPDSCGSRQQRQHTPRPLRRRRDRTATVKAGWEW